MKPNPFESYALAARWITHDEAIDQFLAVFPDGFTDGSYATGKGARAAVWRAAHERWAEIFADREGERLVAAGELDDLVKRLSRVDDAIASLHPAADAGAVTDALSNDDVARPFYAALFELRAGSGWRPSALFTGTSPSPTSATSAPRPRHAAIA